MRVLSEKLLDRLVPAELAIAAAEEAFRIHSQNIAQIPLRSEIHRKNPPGTALIMSGLVQDLLGVKLVASIENSAAGNKATTCLMLVWDADTLRPRGLLSADKLNIQRTAAGFAAATKVLSRPDSATHAIFGAGKLSFFSLKYVCEVRPIRKVFIVSRTEERVRRLAAQIAEDSELAGLEVVTDAPPSEAVAQADIVTAVTTSDTPVFDGAAVRAGTHLNLGGANRAYQREADDNVARRASFWTDANDACLTRAGDIIIPLENKVIAREQIVAEIGEVLLGNARGRASADEITIFKSLGIATQDLVLAGRVLDLAEASDSGTEIDI